MSFTSGPTLLPTNHIKSELHLIRNGAFDFRRALSPASLRGLECVGQF